MSAVNETLYLKIDKNTIVTDRHVTLGDIAKMECPNQAIVRQLKQKKLYSFQDAMDTKRQKNEMQVFSVLKVIELIHEEYPSVDVTNEGESDFIVEYIPNPEKPKWLNAIKTVVLCVIIFFGSAFTIMAFNNDISVTDIFSKFYLQVMGKPSNGVTELEICYSIGMAIGITVFFNHVGHKKITPDPTPIQVEMRKYENDIDTAFIENAERKGHSVDVK
ncbi:MAG: stage V sporulation protein AA [Roseburia sp.]|nr:stage V sporulation protein AA [Roseburia sp.]